MLFIQNFNIFPSQISLFLMVSVLGIFANHLNPRKKPGVSVLNISGIGLLYYSYILISV